MTLTESQQRAVDLVGEGKNIFISGSAGTGKSYTIEAIKEKYPYVYLTASTGIAAINIGGETLHRWSGIKPDHETVKNVTDKLWWEIRLKIEKARAILVDEVSMVSGSFIDLLDGVLKKIRRNNSPFGGIQIVVVGDFLQLPPVGDEELFCFESQAWKDAKFEGVHLDKIFRQEKDTQFIDFLTRMREGKLNKEDFKVFEEKCCVDRPHEDYVRLYPTNKECDNINYSKLKELPDDIKEFHASAKGDKYEIEWFFRNSLIQERVDLKVGARVMMLKNTYIDFGVANGSTGTITGIFDNKVNVKFDNGENLIIEREYIPINKQIDGQSVIVATIGQIPLRLSWAITIHKAQGMSLDKVYCDLERIFTHSQVYVALSRAKDMEHLYVENFRKEQISFHPSALDFVNKK
jgi:ATP-dependent exoDNAse (exonuclease V) alpha subunit